MFGRLGRALLAPFATRQYSRNPGRVHPLNSELKECISWWIPGLSNATPRKALLTPPQPILVYCDPAGSGRIAFVLIYGSARKTGHTHLPERFCTMAGIYEFEFDSAIFALHAASLVFPGQTIILCCDNSAAASNIVRGNCESDLGRNLAAVFWAAASASCTPVWVEEVRSKFNNADPPFQGLPLGGGTCRD